MSIDYDNMPPLFTIPEKDWDQQTGCGCGKGAVVGYTCAQAERKSKWDQRFLDLASFISTWSKDPSTKVGAVIVDDQRRVVSVGYNGFAQGVEDSDERLNDRETKYKMVVHGERNAILFAGRPVTNCTLYTVPFMPCATCASMVIQAGIKRVVAPYSNNERWLAEFALAALMFREAGVTLDLIGEPVEKAGG